MRLLAFILLSLTLACTQTQELRFTRLTEKQSGIDFNNKLSYTEQLNPYTYKNFYNGGGVGIGDINNDGRPDIFFCGNQVSNKLYLNKGGMKFEDITEQAGLMSQNVWSAGVSMVDINGDGLLDIYVCKSGPPGGDKRHNELFINNGDMTFKEQSVQYGLDNEGLSSHAAFFDFDKDGDLDCYLLNNSIKSVGGYDMIKDQRNLPDSLGGNKLLRNDSGYFSDVTTEAGIYASDIGFGLGVTIGDINRDHWPDIYVSNDFFERDYLYINDQKGGFTESIEQYIQEMSLGSMGADFADINNDGLSEIFVTEMLPEQHERLVSKAIFQSWDKHQLMVENGYANQFGRNVLQLNNGNNTFSEIGRYAGVEATDWSWGALIFDMDNDGYKDIFVANGIYKDLLDLDYVNFMSQPGQIKNIIKNKKDAIKSMIDLMPSEPLANYAFHNRGENTFENKAGAWGLTDLTFSSGAAYGDLDNDGDLDLVVNNVNMPSWIYQNNTQELDNLQNHLTIQLKGVGQNSQAIGSKIKVYAGGQIFYQELNPFRGFESTVDTKILFGLGTDKPDSLEIIWPDGYSTLLYDVPVNERLSFDQKEEQKMAERNDTKSTIFKEQTDLLSFTHKEQPYVDFDKDRLLFQMNSSEGPCQCKADVNHDGRADLYVGGASGQSGALFIQDEAGFQKINKPFDQAISSEDLSCAFFDANGDGHLDLYVASGSSEFDVYALGLLDHLFFGDGHGAFKDSHQKLPNKGFESSSVVVPYDFDQDGDMDLFVGGRQRAGYYGVPTNSHLLENDGSGKFTNMTQNRAPLFLKLGMVTDALTTDLDQDGVEELIVVGHWMAPKVFKSHQNQLIDATDQFELGGYAGLYNTIAKGDFNEDGYVDLIFGNQGTNSRYHASTDYPLGLLVNDFDQNGSIDLIVSMFDDKIEYPLVQLKELSMQLPYIKKDYLKFSDFKTATLKDIFGEKLDKGGYHLKVNELKSFMWMNHPKADYHIAELPYQFQLFPIYDFLLEDFNTDGYIDLLAAGNFLRAKPEIGSNMGGHTALGMGNGSDSFKFVMNSKTGISISEEVRSIESLYIKDKQALVFGINNGSNKIFVKNEVN